MSSMQDPETLTETESDGGGPTVQNGSGAEADSVTERTDPSPEQPPLEVVFEVLKNARRRRVLEYLQTESNPETIGALSEHLAAIENDKSVEALTSQERKRVYVGLYQCHLPKMDDMGFVEFDSDRGTVTLGPHADAASEYLEAEVRPEETTPDHHRRYLALAGVAWALLAAGFVAPAGLLAPLTVVGLTLVTAYAIVHAGR